jgi:hypothetical protein
LSFELVDPEDDGEKALADEAYKADKSNKATDSGLGSSVVVVPLE